MRTFLSILSAAVIGFIPALPAFANPHLAVVARKRANASSAVSPGTANLVAWWSLDASPWVDSHSGGYTLTPAAAPSAVSALVGNGVDIESGSSQYLERADNAALEPGNTDWTVVAWVNLESLGADRGILQKLATSGNQREYALRYNNTATQFTFLVSPDGAATTTVSSSTFGTPSTATWYFVHAYHDATANQIGISVNAGAIDTAAHSTGIFAGTANFFIGRYGNSAYMDGILDEVAMFNRLLTSDEVTWLYNAGAGRAFGDL